jgi:hypothetical protein
LRIVTLDDAEYLPRLEHVARQGQALDQAASGGGADIERGPIGQHLDETISLEDEIAGQRVPGTERDPAPGMHSNLRQ